MASQVGKPELRKDHVTNRWVLFSPARAKRPTDFKAKSPANPDQPQQCPFCIGNEHQCAPEIFRIPHENPKWKIRVIENLYPALSRTLPQEAMVQHARDSNTEDDCNVLGGFGFHDVVIESPIHSVQLEGLSPEEIAQVLLAYKTRIQQLADNESIRYVQIFKNHGASAGASMSHSHSQMIALPIVPPAVSTRLDSMKQFFDQKGKCCLCENFHKDLTINASEHFISIVPFAATFPFEIWIIPLHHTAHFHELNDDEAVDLGGLLKLILRKMSLQFNNPPFNFMIHASPLQANESQLGYSHWYIQIVPQLGVVGGFELGSGCHINPVFPEDAAKVLREVAIPQQLYND